MAIPVLEQEIFDIEYTEMEGLSVESVLQYFYYGGMVYTGMKQFEKALQMFSVVSEYYVTASTVFYSQP
jgi:COP9 signalosome complex subunit 3